MLFVRGDALDGVRALDGTESATGILHLHVAALVAERASLDRALALGVSSVGLSLGLPAAAVA
jgi:hypothetical protein